MLDDQRIAYQLIGSGGHDLVISPSWFSAFDIEWEQPELRWFFERISEYARVIRFDRRGSGASDPLKSDELPVWETFADDISCVMDHIGLDSAFLYADGDGGPIATLFAATHPDRVNGLILFHTSARFLTDDDYPIGFPREYIEQATADMSDTWGTGEMLDYYIPSRAGDEELARWLGRLMRAVTTPSSVKKYMDGVVTADVRDILPTVHPPVLLLDPVDSQLPMQGHARYMADRLPNATLKELEGPGDVYPMFALGAKVESAIREFVTGAPVPVPAQRSLATVLFTDIVESTARAGETGDGRWRELLDLHDETVRKDLARHSGELVKNTGDGILATFEGPGRAIGFASALQADLDRLGLPIRTGIHTGEVERRNGDIGGVAVHLGARIMSVADAGEILVSRTVKDLVIGSPIRFEDRGLHALKGFDGEWQLYSVAGA